MTADLRDKYAATAALIVAAVNALPGLLDALAGMERERDACCADYQREAARAVEAENEGLALLIRLNTIRAMLTEGPLDTALVGIRRLLGIEGAEPETEGGRDA